jgi:hypothetical protein
MKTKTPEQSRLPTRKSKQKISSKKHFDEDNRNKDKSHVDRFEQDSSNSKSFDEFQSFHTNTTNF